MFARASPVPHHPAVCWSYLCLCRTPRKEEGAAFLRLAHFQAWTRHPISVALNSSERWGGFQFSPSARVICRFHPMHDHATCLKWVADFIWGAVGNLSKWRSLMSFTHNLFPVLLCVCMCMHVCFWTQVFANVCVEARGTSGILLYHSPP